MAMKLQSIYHTSRSYHTNSATESNEFMQFFFDIYFYYILDNYIMNILYISIIFILLCNTETF